MTVMKTTLILSSPASLPVTVLPKAPFALPSLNKAAIESRYSKASNVLRQFMSMHLASKVPGLARAYAPLWTLLSSLVVSDPHDFVSVSSALHNHFKLYVLQGSVASRGDIPIRLWDKTLGMPSVLYPPLNLVASTKDKELRLLLIRITLSILEIYKATTVPVAPSLSSITDPFSGSSDTAASIESIGEVITSLGIDPASFRETLKHENSSFTFHETTAAGPNGHALWSAHFDSAALVLDQKLMEYWSPWCTQWGLEELYKRGTECYRSVFQEAWSTIGPKTEDAAGLLHSKLHCIYEKGSKARVIAIVDYFTQAALSPLHNALQTTLKSLPCDFTFDQEAGAEKVRQLTIAYPGDVYSLDLSKATDRLPLAFQKRILAYLLADSEAADL